MFLMDDLWFCFYKTLAVTIEIQKGTEMDQNAIISGFFFHNNCILVHFCALFTANVAKKIFQVTHNSFYLSRKEVYFETDNFLKIK